MHFNIAIVVIAFITVLCVSVTHTCDCCPGVNNKLDNIESVLKKLLEGNGGAGNGGNNEGNNGGNNGGNKPVCKPINFARVKAITSSNGKQISEITQPYGAIARGNDVYILGYGDLYMYHYNSQIGRGTKSVGKKYKVPSGAPFYIDIYNGQLYVTNSIGDVYSKPLTGGAFTSFLHQKEGSKGIKWSPDGKRLLVGDGSGKVHVYDGQSKRLLTTFTHCTRYPRETSFDSNNNIQITTFESKICIYNGNNYKQIQEKEISGAKLTVGFLQHCDGTIIMADWRGNLLFLDKNYNTKHTITGYGILGDVALTTDGTLYVTDFKENKVYLYKGLL